jgi:hypothetical protein
MRGALKFCWRGTRFCAECAGLFALWTLWLGLALVLGLQIWIACSHELVVPRPILRALEKQLAESQLAVRFGRATFDSAGRVLLEDFSVSTTTLAEPLVRGHLLYASLDPWALLAGRFETRGIEAEGVELLTPAMFSPTGRSEALVHDLDFLVRPDSIGTLTIERLVAHFADVDVSARGAIALGAWKQERKAPLTPAEFFSKNYLANVRRLAELAPLLAAVERAQIELICTPSPARGAIVQARLLAAGARLESPLALQAGPLLLETRFPLTGETAVTARLDATVASLTAAQGAARDVRVQLRGLLRPATFAFEPREADVAAAEVTAAGETLTAPVAHLEPGPLPRLRTELVAQLGDTPVHAAGDLDLHARSGTVQLETRLTNAVVAVVGRRLGRDLTGSIQFTTPARVSGAVVLGAGGKLERASGWAEADRFTVWAVALDHVAGHVELQGSAFRATDAVLRQGENVARGSYTMDLATRDFRFLLKGGLRPTDISPWFIKGDWWPKLWANFDFAAALPTADVDVLGRWGTPGASIVFVAAESAHPVVRGAAFDYVRTRLFIRTHYVHALDLLAVRGAGELRGWFSRLYDPVAGTWRAMDFDLHSSIDLSENARLFGPEGEKYLAPYRFEQPPRVAARGHLDGPAATGGAHQKLQFEVDSTGAFQLFGFPLQNTGFTAELNDDELKLDRVRTEFASGAVEGKVRLWGRGPERRLGFEATLRQARLAEAVTALEHFGAQRKGVPLPTKSAFLERMSDIRIDLALSAEGRANDTLSFHGEGNAQFAGSELGQVRMLGLLSDLLRFTSLRFTAARANFKVAGPRLEFPEVRVTGRNSAIDAHGSYALDTKTLDFNAKVFPFEESHGLIQGALGLVLLPFSQFLEVKLTGKLDNPAWAFLYGPGNLLRTMAQPEPTSAPPAPPSSPASPPP